MTSQPFKTPDRIFSEALSDVCDRGLTTRKELGQAADCSRQAIDNSVNDFCELGIEKARRIVKRHPHAEVRRILAAALLAGTEFMISTEAGEMASDTNLKDALGLMSQLICDAGEEMKQLVADIGKTPTDEEIQRLIDGGHKLRADLSKLIGTIERASRFRLPMRASG